MKDNPTVLNSPFKDPIRVLMNTKPKAVTDSPNVEWLAIAREQ